MEWIEIIRLRTSGANEKKKALEVLSDLRMSVKEQSNYTIHYYYRANLDTDISIHIQGPSEVDKHLPSGPNTGFPTGSDLGFMLEQYLRQYGIVDRTLWTECVISSPGQEQTIPIHERETNDFK